MDPVVLAGMIFSLVVIAMIGSFILLFPLSRRLGEALEVWLEERREGSGEEGELRRIREVVGLLASRVEAMEDRQSFVEDLLERPRDRPTLGSTEDEGPG